MLSAVEASNFMANHLIQTLRQAQGDMTMRSAE